MNRPPPSTPAQQNEEGCGCAGCLLVPLIPVYFWLLAVFFIYVVPAVAGVAAIVAVLWILYRHGVALKSTIRNTRRIAGGDEPAIQQYFYGAAWHELRVAAGSTNQSAIAQCGKTSKLGKTFFREKPEVATVPLGIACYIVLAVSAPVAYVALGASIVLHATVVIVCVGALTIFVGVLRSAELVSMVVRRIYLVCPNRDCHQRIALPVYGCPRCGARHKALLPGSYGATRRRCRCGNVLPTLFLLGRSRIPAFCPHASCGKPLNEAIGSARNVHLSVIGGPYVGKTAFLTAAMLEIRRKGAVEMQLPDRADEAAFEAAASRFEKGIPVDKTACASPNAILLSIEDAREQKSLLYIYDAAGELYAEGSDLRRQKFFSHTNGVALLVDPFSLESVGIDRRREIAALEPRIRASAELPQDVYDRMVMTLRGQRGGNRLDVPLAVVVTKVDAAGIDREIDAVGVRDWLIRHGEGNLVQSAEHDFRIVRFFACSALGRVPSSTATEPFVSRGVLEPFQWLAEANGVRL
jgi:hypothetical protein